MDLFLLKKLKDNKMKYVKLKITTLRLEIDKKETQIKFSFTIWS